MFTHNSQSYHLFKKVGLPSQSGISGGMLVIVPNVMGICLWSPPVDDMCNSVRGTQFCIELIKKYSFHRFVQNDKMPIPSYKIYKSNA